MHSPASLTRRDFLAATAAATVTAALGTNLAAENAADRPIPLIAPPASQVSRPIIGFSKPFQKLNATATAELVAEIGWDGIECPVRTKGQIEPAHAADLLPAYVDALRRQGHDVHLVTTEITSLATPHAESLLRTAAQLGLKRIRLGFLQYDAQRDIQQQLRELAPAFKDLAAACADLGLQAGYQNHSGADSVGGPVWDVFGLIRSLDPRHMGFCFDIGHATIEGGLSWPIEARLAEPFYTAVFVKDFSWEKHANGRSTPEWCPLGDGLVSPSFFERLKRSSFAGPISQHHEYEVGDDASMRAHFKRDLAKLKSWLA